MILGLASTFPEFSPGDLLTTEGEKRLDMVRQISAAISSAVAILSGVDLLKPNWKANTHFRQYQRPDLGWRQGNQRPFTCDPWQAGSKFERRGSQKCRKEDRRTVSVLSDRKCFVV